MKTGLTSVSFRRLTADEVIRLAALAGVDGIEWGSDIHVPQTDIVNAVSVAEKTRAAGLEVISYGSYFYLGEGMDFAPFIEAAIAIGTKTIRIWGGKKERQEISADQYAALVAEARKIGEMAAAQGITVSLEYHGHSITATAKSAAEFIENVNMPNVRLYWQPIIGRSAADNLEDIDIIAPYLTNVHVFNYIEGKQELLEVGEGIENWKSYFTRISKISGDRAFLTEFCKGGLAESFIADAATLNSIVKSI